jgi:hypothetical protein
VNEYPVPKNQIFKYYVKLTNVSKNYLMAGFCTEKGFGKCMVPESAYYNCNGFLLMNVIDYTVNLKTTQGETIECIADLVNFKLRWAKEGNIFSEAPIPF